MLQVDSLPQRLSPTAETRAVAEYGDEPVIRTLAVVERQALAEALDISGDNITAAARGLGINRTTLYRKLKKHGLQPSK